MMPLRLWMALALGGRQLAGGVSEGTDPVQVTAPLPAEKPGSLQDDLFFQMVGWTSKKVRNAHVNAHFVKVSDPRGRFSVSPPLPGGCGTLNYVAESGKHHDPECLISINGGMFDVQSERTKEGIFDCFGNLVSNGEVVQTRPFNISNAQFGVKKSGEFVVGYVTPEEAASGEFEQLIEGLGWLVRDGENYVEAGWEEAYQGAGAGGSGYAAGTSGRVGIGFDAAGALLILVVDGHTGAPSWGATMYELADKLIELGAVQAINLDGGGSTQIAFHGVQVGYSSDRAAWGPLAASYDPECPVGTSSKNLSAFECLRRVSSFVCVHERPGAGGFNYWWVAAAIAAVGAVLAVLYFQFSGKGGKDGGDSEEDDDED